MSKIETVISKFTSREATIGIVGLGYVGLPLSLRFAEAGYRVIGFDIDPKKIELLNRGETYIVQFAGERIVEALENGFLATNDFSHARECDALILCVPTPLSKQYQPDMSFVTDTLESLLPHTRENQVISLESTTYPGTTEEIILPRINERGYTVGENYFVAYSPERENPGNQEFNTQTIPKVIGGISENCLSVGLALYKGAIDTLVPVSSTKTAEMTKLLENIYRAVNIGLVNEMKIVADKMNIDINEVIDAAATKPFGFTKYSPGPGLGGHCIPIDPFYLTWKAKEYNINTRFIELSGEINRAMPDWVVNKLTEALNDHGKPLKGSKILVLGIAYKKNVDDSRESPSIKIMEILRSKGSIVEYSDPFIPKFPKMREHKFELVSSKLSPENIAKFDGIIIATDHDQFDYDLIKQKANLIVDTRNRFKNGKNVIFA